MNLKSQIQYAKFPIFSWNVSQNWYFSHWKCFAKSLCRLDPQVILNEVLLRKLENLQPHLMKTQTALQDYSSLLSWDILFSSSCLPVIYPISWQSTVLDFLFLAFLSPSLLLLTREREKNNHKSKIPFWCFLIPNQLTVLWRIINKSINPSFDLCSFLSLECSPIYNSTWIFFSVI